MAAKFLFYRALGRNDEADQAQNQAAYWQQRQYPHVADRLSSRQNLMDGGIMQTNLFAHSRTVVIGTDAYANGIPRLTTAVNDAARLAHTGTEAHP